MVCCQQKLSSADRKWASKLQARGMYGSMITIWDYVHFFKSCKCSKIHTYTLSFGVLNTQSLVINLMKLDSPWRALSWLIFYLRCRSRRGENQDFRVSAIFDIITHGWSFLIVPSCTVSPLNGPELGMIQRPFHLINCRRGLIPQAALSLVR